MTQTESDFVVKLFYTFQSRDYLYLVMEYLNGGDCAALIKNMGELPEEWARKYIAEVVVGLEYLHASGIVHRSVAMSYVAWTIADRFVSVILNQITSSSIPMVISS